MNINDLITSLNTIFLNHAVPIDLKSSDYDCAVVESTPLTEICRWQRKELRAANDIIANGIINPTLGSRAGGVNGNSSTHFFITAGSRTMFSPFLSTQIDGSYSFCYPFNLYSENINLLLNHLPEDYYSEERIDYLRTQYPLNEIHNLELSVKATGQRIMFASKDNVLPSSEKIFFLENRYSFFEGDFTVILKHKKEMKYTLLLIPSTAIPPSIDFNAINGALIGSPSNTVFSLSSTTRAIGGHNLLVFGAPGTGKSRWIKDHYEKITEYIRVIFHEEYSYQDFVGSLKPNVDKNGDVSYIFKPGPFSRILKLAVNNPMQKYTLIIEELNRANAAATFGDLFQLLDRDEDGNSEYEIENEDVVNYVNKDIVNGISYPAVTIPSNLSIVSTMNSADQGVFSLDTAFKRRWDYEYISIQFDSWHSTTTIPYFSLVDSSTNVMIEHFISIKNYIETINDYLGTHPTLEINEDRLVGPYFLKPIEWEEWVNRQSFKKILVYLWDDVARLDRNTLFLPHFTQFKQVCDSCLNNEQIFNESLHQLLLEKCE